MKKIFTNIHTMAALLIASATFVACSNDDNTIGEQPTNPTEPQVYAMTVNASKNGGTTRALSLDGSTLNATWATTENIYVKKGSTWATGSLQPQDNAATATLKGTLSGISIATSDELTLQFPKSGNISYDGQVGTLTDIAANFDYATATVTVNSISGGNITTTGTANFVNQQAIVKFMLKKYDGTELPSNPTAFTVSDGTSTVSLTSIPAATYTTNGNGVLYVAFPATGTSKTVTLTATVDDDTYTYEKAAVTLVSGQYYAITVKMARVLASAKTDDIGKIAGANGRIYDTKAAAETAGTTAVAMIAYVGSGTDNATYKHGLAIALADENPYQSLVNWSTAKSTCEGKTAVTGAAWLLPSQNQWKAMFKANGNDDGLYSGLNAAISAAKGTPFYAGYYYWSSSEYSVDNAYIVYLRDGAVWWYNDPKVNTNRVRACLAF